MLALFFDTETTGVVQWSAASVDPVQPNLVQLGAKLVDLEDRSLVHAIDVIVTPNGQWEIPEGAAAVHKITTAKAERVGVMLEHAVLPFRDMVAVADLYVAHNFKFDKIVMERASAMVDLFFTPPGAKAQVQPLWNPKSTKVCTMLKSTPIVKKKSARPQHNGDYGWPKLFEALKHFTGRDLEGAHNAMVDVIACEDIFYALADHTTMLDEILPANLRRQSPAIHAAAQKAAA